MRALWNDAKWLRLSAEAKTVLLVLLTHPASRSGRCDLPEQMLAALAGGIQVCTGTHVGMDPCADEGTCSSKVLLELEEAGIVGWEEDEIVVNGYERWAALLAGTDAQRGR